jgi:SAM-dependent methyltransferase
MMEGKYKETIMKVQQDTVTDQATLWNGVAGHAWVETQDLLDRIFEPFEDLLVERACAGSGGAVLDVGCGTGATTLSLARRLGDKGRCVGVDVSEPMIAAARGRAEQDGTPATFICADAEGHAFEHGSFDTIVSRFGVMFFGDPVSAFANLRRAARDGAELHFIPWRSGAENPFMTTAERAATPLLPDLPARRPDGPGQFAFGDRQKVENILRAGGWTDVEIQPLDVECTFPEAELVRYFTRLGPVGVMLRQVDDRTRTEVIRAVRAAFDPFVDGTEVRFNAACWMVSARASG